MHHGPIGLGPIERGLTEAEEKFLAEVIYIIKLSPTPTRFLLDNTTSDDYREILHPKTEFGLALYDGSVLKRTAYINLSKLWRCRGR